MRLVLTHSTSILASVLALVSVMVSELGGATLVSVASEFVQVAAGQADEAQFRSCSYFQYRISRHRLQFEKFGEPGGTGQTLGAGAAPRELLRLSNNHRQRLARMMVCGR